MIFNSELGSIRNAECGIRNYGIASGDNILKTLIDTTQGESLPLALCILL